MRTIWGWVATALLVACGSGGSDTGTTTASSSGGSSSGGSSSGGSSGTGSSSGDECADCGKCGIAGPVNVTGMTAQTFGVDATGRAAVTVNLANEGDCQGENKHPSTIHVAATNDAIEVTPDFEQLDRTKAKPDTSTGGVTKYDWNDRDLSVKVNNGGSAGLDLTFSSGGTTLFSVKCLPVGERGSCTKE